MANQVNGGTPIAARLRAEMKRHVSGKVVNLKAVLNGRAAAEELQRTVVTPQALAGMHPTHAAYTYAQNQVSVMSEMLTTLDAMEPFADLVSEAEELYMPSGPPMSPLTVSYFTCWAFFDACVGPTDETLGTTILDVGAEFGMHSELLRVIRLMQRSRMGVYHHEGTDGGLAVLRDLVTDAVSRCIVPAGYIGEKGQLWYARILPPPLHGGSEHIVFTTPYVILAVQPDEWTAYFRRVSTQTSQQARIDECERHMKYGPSRNYWHEFVFEGYVNHRPDAIFLDGLPDVPESRPHSKTYAPRSR